MTKTRNYYTPSNYEDHTTFGGIISSYDFDGHHTLSSMADKIIADMRFDKQCALNAKFRSRNKKEV